LIQIEFDITVGKLTQKVGEQLREKFNGIITENQKNLNSYKKDEVLLSDTKGWINWVERMNKELGKVPNYNLSKKTTFLRENAESITFASIKLHKLFSQGSIFSFLF